MIDKEEKVIIKYDLFICLFIYLFKKGEGEI